MFRIDDIIASLILALCMMRRLEVLAASRDRNPHVSAEDFRRWREMGLAGYRVCAYACVSKIVLSLLWLWSSPPQPWLQVGGITIFIAWVVVLVSVWRKTTEAAALRRDLNIDVRRA